jgi:hypothetical protein
MRSRRRDGQTRSVANGSACRKADTIFHRLISPKAIRSSAGRPSLGRQQVSAKDAGEFERGPRVVPGKLGGKRKGNGKQDEGKNKGRSVQCHNIPPFSNMNKG